MSCIVRIHSSPNCLLVCCHQNWRPLMLASKSLQDHTQGMFLQRIRLLASLRPLLLDRELLPMHGCACYVRSFATWTFIYVCIHCHHIAMFFSFFFGFLCRLNMDIRAKFIVCETQVRIPKFAAFSRRDVAEPSGAVKFPLQQAQAREVVNWVNRHFLLAEPVQALVPPIGFSSAEGSIYLVQHGNDLVIGADTSELASSLLQSLTAEVQLKAAENARSSFPGQLEALRETLQRVSDLHAVRQKLSVEIADQSNLAKSLLLRAEDYRLMGNIALMKGTYAQLGDVNRDLAKSYNIRNSNYDELVKQLKALNQFINKTAELHVGKARTDLINACRAAIKANDMDQLFNLLKGSSADVEV
eukprot:m.185583 g.185583  ORF g.185583 m.185583 type:complete len:358 (-) comp16685_c3_seq3:33-1106(-)